MLVTAKSLEHQLKKVRELEARLTFRLSVLSKQLDQQAHDMLSGTGINLTAYRILNVAHTFETASVSDISRFCAIDRGQVSRTTVDLEKRGFITFKDDPVSQRKKIVTLSAEGEALLAKLSPPFLARNAGLNDLLGPDRLDVLNDMINLLSDSIADQQSRS